MELGLLIFGYNKNDKQIIEDSYNKCFDTKFKIFSSDNIENKISKILQDEITIFKDNKDKFIILLGFKKSQIQKALNCFPKEITRPIFSMLTNYNINWTQKKLLEDLKSEKAYFDKKNKK